MTCERTQKQRIRFHATTASRLTKEPLAWQKACVPFLTRDRVETLEPTWICGAAQPESRCSVFPCDANATHECDGCDEPICRAHATNRGMQDVQFATGIDTPGWDRATIQDTYDLCPFCLFDGEKKGRSR